MFIFGATFLWGGLIVFTINYLRKAGQRGQ